MDDASNPPSTEPKGAPPTGSLTNTATCCPTVSTFEGSRVPDRVYGFDARTNLAQTRNQDEYWIPPDKAKAAPGDMFTQDGAAWASVGVGMTTELEISFEGQSGNGCLTNCTFEQTNPGIVQIETQRVSSSGTAFRLRGMAEGETSIRVMCQGAELGWVHVVCFKLLKLRAAVGHIQTELTKTIPYNAAELQKVLNRAFKHALIEFEVSDVGAIDLGNNPAFHAIEKKCRSVYPLHYINDEFGDIRGKYIFFPAPAPDYSTLAFLLAIAESPKVAALTGARIIPLLYYIPSDTTPDDIEPKYILRNGPVRSMINGIVPQIGFGPAFAFKESNGTLENYSVLAHEVGHVLGLVHPDEKGADAQLADHLVASSGTYVQPEPATNTEPAIMGYTEHELLRIKKDNIMSRDPLNLMGYWPVFHDQLFIRRRQWDVAREFAISYWDPKE